MGNVDATPHTKFVSNFLKKQINFHIENIRPLKFENNINLKNASFSYNHNNENIVLKDIV